MEGDVWDVVERQRRAVVDDPPRSVEEFRTGSRGWPSLGSTRGSGDTDGEPPISAYTKSCAWASDYVWANRRAIVFLDPGGLREQSLEEFVRREFGCSRRTFVKQVADGWLVPTVDRREAYPDRARSEIEALFADVAEEAMDSVVRPRYAHLAGEALGAALLAGSADADGFVRSESGERIDVGATVTERTRREPWSNLPDAEFFLHGVGGNVREYVTDRLTRLELADEVLGEDLGIGPKVDSLLERVREYTGDDLQSLLGDTYLTWNLLGSPMYDSDFSGTTDVGENVATEYQNRVMDVLERVQSTSSGEDTEVFETASVEPTPIRLPDREGVDVETLFGVSPKEHGLVFGELEALAGRIAEHDRYYERVRDGASGCCEGLPSMRGGVPDAFTWDQDAEPLGWYSTFGSVAIGQWSDSRAVLFLYVANTRRLRVASDRESMDSSGGPTPILSRTFVGLAAQTSGNRFDLRSPTVTEINLSSVNFWSLGRQTGQFRPLIEYFTR